MSAAGAHMVRWATSGQRNSAARARMTGIDGAGLREKDDFYPTPPEATRGLLRVEPIVGAIWEPACGDGAMSRELEAAGHQVTSTDLVDRGYGQARVDFLMERQGLAPNVVTNPPFRLASAFARQALRLTTGKVALLVKLTFAEGQERADVLDDPRLARVWVFRRRISFQRGSDRAGNGMMCFAWYVWEHGNTSKPTMGWI